MPVRFRTVTLALLAVIGLSLAACEDSTYVPNVTTPTYIRMAPSEPPGDEPEEVLRSDTPQTEIWRPGYWAYLHGQFEWVAGGLMARPSPTAVWSADHWNKLEYGWVFVPGYWQ